ncbi:unnamed protein product, partial [Rotaria sp. Silwood2]
MQRAQVIPVIEKKPVCETEWHFDTIFEQNFKENGLRG